MDEQKDGNPQEAINPQDEPTIGVQEQEAPDPFADFFNSEVPMFGAPDTEQPAEQSAEQPQVQDKKELSKQEQLDQASFRYWQSEADKRQNEINRLRAQLDEPQTTGSQPALPPRNPETGQFVQQDSALPERTAQPDNFPDPPKKPERPRTFSRIDANTDDNSESARYLDDLEQWRTDMVEYNSLRMQFGEVQRANQWKAQQEEVRRQRELQKARAQQSQQLQQIASSLRDGYQATDDQISDFMQEMSRNESVTIDNLWRLYAFNHGIPVQPQQAQSQQIQPQQQKINQPSPAFSQISQAQQVPSPMGILPSDGSAGQRSATDVMIDEMVAMEKRENPF